LQYELLFNLTLILLTWRIWWAPNNASRWQMGFNSEFKVWIQCQRNVLLSREHFSAVPKQAATCLHLHLSETFSEIEKCVATLKYLLECACSMIWSGLEFYRMNTKTLL